MTKNQEWLKDRLDTLEGKIDKVTTELIPSLLVQVAQITTEKMTETKTSMRLQSRIYGGIALVISAVSLAVAFIK